MSQLQKNIARIGRREGPAIGFGRAAREQPRAMLLAVLVSQTANARALLEAGADAAIVCAGNNADAKSIIEALAGKDTIVGAWVSALDEAGAEALHGAGCDFVISTLEGTASAAVDTDRMGQVVAVDGGMEDTMLRALGPLGLDGLFLERGDEPMTLAMQLELVRLSSFSGAPLLATAGPETPVSELRVLRDSGTAVVVPPEGTTPEQVKALLERLKAVPPPKRLKRTGGEMALVPSMAAAREEHEHEEEEEEDE